MFVRTKLEKLRFVVDFLLEVVLARELVVPLEEVLELVLVQELEVVQVLALELVLVPLPPLELGS